jgi:hypothetical protein
LRFVQTVINQPINILSIAHKRLTRFDIVKSGILIFLNKLVSLN